MPVDPRLQTHPLVSVQARLNAAEELMIGRELELDRSGVDDPESFEFVVTIQLRLLSDPSRPATLLWLIMAGARAEHEKQSRPGYSLSELEDLWFHLRDVPSILVARFLEVTRG